MEATDLRYLAPPTTTRLRPPKTGTKRVPKQANLTSRNRTQFHEIPANPQVPHTPEATHNPKVAGPNPAPATTNGLEIAGKVRPRGKLPLADPVGEAGDLQCCRFE